MAKDRSTDLSKYLAHLQIRLNQAVPEKHKHRPDVFKNWLKLEIRRTNAKLEEFELNNPGKK
jgi:hypothetical protein